MVLAAARDVKLKVKHRWSVEGPVVWCCGVVLCESCVAAARSYAFAPFLVTQGAVGGEADGFREYAEDGAGGADADGADILWPPRRGLLHLRCQRQM